MAWWQVLLNMTVNLNVTSDSHPQIQILLWGSSHIYSAGSSPHWLLCLSFSISLTDTHIDVYRFPKRSVNDLFQSLSQSSSLPGSPTGSCCSINKIPPVKLSALRFGAYNMEANQKLDIFARHPLWQGQLTRPNLKCRICAKEQTWKWSSTENGNLKSRLKRGLYRKRT